MAPAPPTPAEAGVPPETLLWFLAGLLGMMCLVAAIMWAAERVTSWWETACRPRLRAKIADFEAEIAAAEARQQARMDADPELRREIEEHRAGRPSFNPDHPPLVGIDWDTAARALLNGELSADDIRRANEARAVRSCPLAAPDLDEIEEVDLDLYWCDPEEDR